MSPLRGFSAPFLHQQAFHPAYSDILLFSRKAIRINFADFQQVFYPPILPTLIFYCFHEAWPTMHVGLFTRLTPIKE
jgi:hypothetical protein